MRGGDTSCILRMQVGQNTGLCGGNCGVVINGSVCGAETFSPEMFQKFTVVSKLPLMRRFDWASNTIVEIVPVWPSSVAVSWPSVRFQSRMALSLSPEAKMSGPQKQSENVLPGRSGNCFTVPSSLANTINGPSPAKAICDESGLKAKALIGRPSVLRSAT